MVTEDRSHSVEFSPQIVTNFHERSQPPTRGLSVEALRPRWKRIVTRFWSQPPTRGLSVEAVGTNVDDAAARWAVAAPDEGALRRSSVSFVEVDAADVLSQPPTRGLSVEAAPSLMSAANRVAVAAPDEGALRRSRAARTS